MFNLYTVYNNPHNLVSDRCEAATRIQGWIRLHHQGGRGAQSPHPQQHQGWTMDMVEIRIVQIYNFRIMRQETTRTSSPRTARRTPCTSWPSSTGSPAQRSLVSWFQSTSSPPIPGSQSPGSRSGSIPGKGS